MSMIGTRWWGLLLLCSVAQAALPEADPAAVGMDPQQLARIDELVAEGLAAGEMAGCVVCVGHQGASRISKPTATVWSSRSGKR